MKINDILTMNPDALNRMTKKELSKAVSKLSSAANKRIKSLEITAQNDENFSSPALDAVSRSGGKFSVANKNINQLRSEYSRVTQFLKFKTSTVRGAKEVQKQFKKRMGKALSPSETKVLFSVYHKLEELEPHFLKSFGSDQMQKFLANEIIQGETDTDSLVSTAVEKIEQQYIEKEDEMGDDEMGDFFEL